MKVSSVNEAQRNEHLLDRLVRREIDMTLDELLKDWSDPLGARTMSEAEELIDALTDEVSRLRKIEKHIDVVTSSWSGYLQDLEDELEKEQSHNAHLQIVLAGKEAVIKELEKDIKYYKKDWRDQMMQDQ